MKNLIIVESPTKARTIKNFLSKDYQVIASKGHVRDLPKSSFGIKIEEEGNFKPEYRTPREQTKIVKEIKELAKNADTVYIATDEDREGEAIGYHIAIAIGKNPEELPRIVFHEITKTAIKASLKSPRKIDLNSFNAQQTRRLLDRIVGYKLSPLLGSKIQKGLSAGRVQSSSLKIIVDREREIKAFKKEEFWRIDGLFEKTIEASLVEFDGKKIDKTLTLNKGTNEERKLGITTIANKEEAQAISQRASQESFVVEKIEKKERKSTPAPPFMTSTLQQNASSMLGYSPKRTMMIAQTLYEGVQTQDGTMGVITYMRTDSLNIAKEALGAVRDKIKADFGAQYLPSKANYYASKNKGAQEAHEAIRPTFLDFTPAIAKGYLKPEEHKLYSLIYNRFMASQMNPAIFESQNIIFASKSTKFKASGRKLLFDGYYRVYGQSDKDKLLPDLEPNKNAKLDKIDANQHFTEPPSRYSEASLIKKLEGLGIGRPSTYAPTISTLSARTYIEIEKKQICPTEVAFQAIEVLEKHFSNIVDSDFTSNMEETLDKIALGDDDWQAVLGKFYAPFMKQIEDGKQNIKSQKVVTPTGEMCPTCKENNIQSELVKRKGRFGEFIACSTFPKCRYTKNIAGAATKKQAVELEVPCPECGGILVERFSRRGKFYGCKGYPKCKFVSNFEPTKEKCPKCQSMMAKREYRKKEILECSSSECKHRIDL